MAHDAPPRFAFVRDWLPVLLYVALIFTLSSMPHLQAPFHFPNADKVMHLGEYGLLGLLLTRVLHTMPRLESMLAAGFIAVAIGVAIGGVDELYQRGVPGRESSLLDLVADMLGLSLSQIAYAWAHRPRDAAAPPGSGRAAA